MSMIVPMLPGPSWIREWPGRFKAELDSLRRAGTIFQVDEDRLANGELVIDIQWAIGARSLRLKAAYPESFPWTRPQVFLDAPASQMPRRHCSPTDGQLCLLGRDTRQWNFRWTLQELLELQLVATLDNTGEEDSQAEPTEFWWNGFSALDTGFCLVDSTWHPEKVGAGILTLQYTYRSDFPLRMRACAIAASGSGFSATFDSPIQGLKKTVKIPWVHLDGPLFPDRTGEVLVEAISSSSHLSGSRPLAFEAGLQGRIFAFSYPMEIAQGVTGTGWLFAIAVGNLKSRRGGQLPKLEVLQTLRAGPEDLRARDPAAASLAGKRIVVVGAGAIGAPIALGLARGGCTRLDIIDHDRVEPGNTIRWVAGCPSWGLGKAAALKSLIEANHSSCEVNAHQIMIGLPYDSTAALLTDADLIIDATAAYGPGMWLGAHCKSIGVPLLAAMAWADRAVEGGIVALHAPTSGCPHCLDFLEAEGSVLSLGKRSAEPSFQPAGCSERTFLGASYDLQELSLQALRMIPAALDAPKSSVVAILSYEIALGGMRLPRWQLQDFYPSSSCGCVNRVV